MLHKLISKKGNVYKLQELIGKKELWLASDGKGNFAHGETLHQAKEDLRFKLIAEKLKKEPIYPDTVITTQYYRIITGACQTGCEQWKKQNGITKDKMKAKDLVVLLEKTNAYGMERFKELLKGDFND